MNNLNRRDGIPAWAIMTDEGKLICADYKRKNLTEALEPGEKIVRVHIKRVVARQKLRIVKGKLKFPKTWGKVK